MPRDGSNIYHIPPGTPGIPNTTIGSTPYNGYVADIEQDLNLPRPIVAGGTGATDAATALANLNGEMEGQVVTNYDSMVFVAGSFYSAASATNPPVAGHAFSGICYLTDASNLFIEARDQDDATQPGSRYIRQKKAGVWSAWLSEAVSYDARFVNVTGDTMTGLLTLSGDPAAVLGAATKQYVDAGDTALANNKVAKAGDTMTGPLTLSGATGIITAPTKGHQFGSIGGTLATGPVVPADAGVKLYDLGSGNWAGFGVDNNGNVWCRTGLTGTPVPAFYVDTNQVVHFTNSPLGITAAVVRSYLAGLTLSTAGASTSFTVQPGVAVNSTNADSMTLAAALTKTTAAWAVGAGGALDTGTIAANTWYHAHLIKRLDTGVVDVLISLSPTAPTMPASYTLFRRIGSMKTNASSQWTSFFQYGDLFLWATQLVDINVTNPGTAAVTRTLTVPTGIKLQPKITVMVYSALLNGGVNCYISSLDQTDQAASSLSALSVAAGNATTGPVASFTASEVFTMTNTSAQIRSRIDQADASAILRILTGGWTDRRGRDD